MSKIKGEIKSVFCSFKNFCIKSDNSCISKKGEVCPEAIKKRMVQSANCSIMAMHKICGANEDNEDCNITCDMLELRTVFAQYPCVFEGECIRKHIKIVQECFWKQRQGEGVTREDLFSLHKSVSLFFAA